MALTHELPELRHATRLHVDPTLLAHHLFEAQTLRTPEATAVIFGSRSLTYAELDRQANQLAHRLQALGAGPETLVGMACERSPEAILALVAILKAGAAFVPLDPTYPPDRLQFMLEDSAAPIVVTQRATASGFLSAGSKLLILEDEAAELQRQPVTRPESAANPRNLAYVVYTSGSTGQPKGVLIEHRSLVNLVHTAGPLTRIAAGTRVLQFARFSFDASVWEISLTLAAGGTLVMAPQASLIGMFDLTNLIRDRRVEWATLPPTVLAMLDPLQTPSLRVIVSAGEACPAEVIDRWAPGRYFFNGYGPSEITVCSSAAVCKPGEGKPSIGRPLPNSEQWVLDANGQPVPVETPGELWIGGPSVARGYHRRPELTAERFIPNPFSAEPGARLYRTGDLVKWREDGSLDYLGRLDSQVKLRGFRVELGEIEAALRQHAELADVTVAVRELEGGDKQLVAYVISQEVPREPMG